MAASSDGSNGERSLGTVHALQLVMLVLEILGAMNVQALVPTK